MNHKVMPPVSVGSAKSIIISSAGAGGWRALCNKIEEALFSADANLQLEGAKKIREILTEVS